MVTPYWHPVLGGITRFVHELVAELRSSNGIEPIVIAHEGKEEPGVVILRGTGLDFVRRAASELERLRPDAVHTHGHWHSLAAGLLYKHRHPEVTVVFTLHTPLPNRSWWRTRLLRLMFSRADFVTGVSADLLGKTLSDIGFRTRTRVVYPGVRTPTFDIREDADFPRKAGLLDSRPLVGFVGQLVWEEKVRGIVNLIVAMRAVRESVPTATLAVVGDGGHRRKLEEFATSEVPGAVLFLGDLSESLVPFFHSIDVYAHISFKEGLPLAVLEAMASGKPVVASSVGGIPEVIVNGRNGFLVSHDPVDIAKRIVQVLTSPELADSLGANARQDAQERFSWRRTAARFLPLYGARVEGRVAVTVDVEQDYASRGKSFHGVEEALPTILTLFNTYGVRSTCFVTSDLCESYSDKIIDIVRRGHELGCHGESHDVKYLCNKPYAWQLGTISRATDGLESCTGIRPRGFRAPNFSVDGTTLRVLAHLGYEYDSSVLPGRFVRTWGTSPAVDFRVAPRDPYRPSEDDPGIPGSARLWECPVTEHPAIAGNPIGLGFLNMYGVDRTLDAIAKSTAELCVFLVHPWELIDPPPGRPPKWMRNGCTTDSSRLAEFLSRLHQSGRLATLAEGLAEVSRTSEPGLGHESSDSVRRT